MYSVCQKHVSAVLVCVSLALLSNNLLAADARRTALVEAVTHCQESVVNIHTEKDAAAESDSRFFNSKPRRVSGMGTGIVVDERGYIVTNYHVIHDVDQITVTLKDGETLTGRPVSFDRKHDMAIIHVTASKPMTVMNIGTSADTMLAEQVFAVGNAFGYEHTVTAGIVSALGRDVEVDETQSYENLIQTDASINPGNSGGPLLNVNGEVIGINVAIRAGAQRIGFAIPIDDARIIVARLLSTERLNGVTHGLFGTDIKTASDQKLVITDVTPGSAAALCGLSKGDTVNRVRGIEINDAADWERSLLDIPVGQVLDVDVVRDGTPMSLKFTVGVGNAVAATPEGSGRVPVQTVSTKQEVTAPVTTNGVEEAQSLLGLQLDALTARDRSLLGRRYNGGMKVVTVRQGSPAERHGIRSGDILLGLDEFETLNAKNLDFILQESRLRPLKSLSFHIYRSPRGALVGNIDLPKVR